MRIKEGILVTLEIGLCGVMLWLTKLNSEGFFRQITNYSLLAGLIFFATLATWFILMLDRKRWTLPVALFFRDSRRRIIRNNSARLLSISLITLFEIGLFLSLGLINVKNAFNRVYPQVAYNKNWYDIALNLGTVIFIVAFVPLVLHLILRKKKRQPAAISLSSK